MRLYTETVTPYLLDSLSRLMAHTAFRDFRLVGGTALSLLLGHRMSIDIDLFTDNEYGTVNMEEIGNALSEIFPYIDNKDKLKERNIGYSLYCGENAAEAIKIDLYYCDKFMNPVHCYSNIRIADIKDIAAMKILAISNSYRKKDYWDIHELMNVMKLDEMIAFAEKMYPYVIEREEILNRLQNISVDKIDDIPIRTFKEKYWEFVIEDIEESARELR